MPRSFVVTGESMLSVKGGQHFSGNPIAIPSQLGLSLGDVTFTPTFKTRDMIVDDYGPNVPAAVQTMMSEIIVSATLVNYDEDVLNILMDEAMGGGGWAFNQGAAGEFTGQGKPLDGGRNIFMSGNHMISLNILAMSTLTAVNNGATPVGVATASGFTDTIRVRNAYLLNQVQFPWGNKVQAVNVQFRGLPYLAPLIQVSGNPLNSSGAITIDNNVFVMRRQPTSSGAMLWDSFIDTDLADDDPFVEPR